MNQEYDPALIEHLNMNDFTEPDRRMDAFPSRKFDIPPTYLGDTIGIHYASGTDVTVQIEKQTVYMEDGDILLLAPYAVHRTHLMNTDGDIFNIVLRPSKTAEVFPRLFLYDNPVRAFLENCMMPNGPLFLHLPVHSLVFDRAFFPEASTFYRHNTRPDRQSMLLWENRLEHLFLELLAAPELQTGKTEPVSNSSNNLSRILGYVQRNLSTVSLQSTAADLGWNASHLSRYIKQRTGRSFTDIIRVLRLDEATTLLSHTDLSVDEIMEQVGYSGKANFYTIFNERFGVTPFQYRLSQKKTAG